MAQLLRPVIRIKIMREQADERAVHSERIVLDARMTRFEHDSEHLNFAVADNPECQLVRPFRDADSMKARFDLLACGGHSLDRLIVNLNIEVPSARTHHEVNVKSRDAAANFTLGRRAEAR